MTDLHEALTREAERFSPTADLDDVLARADRHARRRRRTQLRLITVGVVAVVALVAAALLIRHDPATDHVVAGPPTTAEPSAVVTSPPGIEIAGGSAEHGTLERRDPVAATGPQSVIVRADDGSLAHHSAVVTYPVDQPDPGATIPNGQLLPPNQPSTLIWAIGDGWARVRTDLGGDLPLAIRMATHVDPSGHLSVTDLPAGLQVVAQVPAAIAVQREARYGSKALGEEAALGDGLTLAASATGGSIEDDLLARGATTDLFVAGQRAALYSPTFTGTAPPSLLGGNGALVWETSPGVVVSVGYSGASESDASVAALARLADRLRVVDEATWAATNPQIIMVGGAVSPIPRAGPTPVSTADAAILAAALVGTTEDEARARVAPYGWTVRVIEIDGVGQTITKDLQANRIDVALRDGRVLGAITFG